MTLDLLADEAELVSATFEAVQELIEGTLQPEEETTSVDGAGYEVWGHDAAPDARHMETGANVAWVPSQGDRDLTAFINRMKTATGWTSYGDPDQVLFDDNGYVISVPDGDYAVSNVLRYNPDLDGEGAFFGAYRLYGTGEAKIRIVQNTGVEVDYVWTTDLPREVVNGQEQWYVDFNYDSTIDDQGRKPMAYLYLYRINEDDHVRDLALVHEDHLEEFAAGDIYTPEFLDDLEGYETLRFMDWMDTNNLEEEYRDGPFSDPEQRYVDPENYTFTLRAAGWDNLSFQETSVPIEYIVALVNSVDANAWINLAADITDAMAIEIGTYVRDNLEDGLSVYFEYGNEIWNSAAGFDSNAYAYSQAIEVFDLDPEGMNNLEVVVEWAAYRGPQLFDLMAEIYAESPDRDVHYVAGTWASDPVVNSNDTFDPTSYSYRYFSALEAQKMADAPSRPEEIVTDYAIGLYFGDPGNNAVTRWIVDHYETMEQQTAALARWLLFGANDDTFHDLNAEALEHPQTVEWREDVNISVYKLLDEDIRAGLDTVGDLESVLRIDGNMLQYQGARADTWTTILIFDEAPTMSVSEMIDATNLIGYGKVTYGESKSGMGSSLQRTAEQRLDGHRDFVEALGLNFVAYEGGMSLPGSNAMPDGINALYDAMAKSDWVAVLTNTMWDKAEDAGLDLFLQYMTHDKYSYGDHWGIKAYVGQPDAETPLREMILAEAALADPEAPAYAGEQIEDWQTARLLADLRVDPGYDWVETSEAAYTTGVTQEGLGANLGVEGGETYVISFDLSRSADMRGDLSFRVQAFGGGSEYLIFDRWSVTEDGHLEFEVVVPEARDTLSLNWMRNGSAAGTLTVSGISVEKLSDKVATAGRAIDSDILSPEQRAFDGDAWKGEAWTFAEGTASIGASNATLKVGGIAVEAGASYRLGFDVDTEMDLAGTLKVQVQAFGGGSGYVAQWSGEVVDGRVEIDLDVIPAPRDTLQVIIRRGEGMSGDIVLSGVSLEKLLPFSPLDALLADDMLPLS